MQVANEAEVLKWLAEFQWNYGIRAEGTRPYYSDPGANCIELKFPDSPLRVTYFARIASMIGIDDESLFYGALLWITLSTIGSPQLVKSGWKMVERMRQGYGENRSLQTAPGHFFRDDELVDLTAFLVPCFVFGWDAYIVPFATKDFFVFVSHDERWGVVARPKEAYDRLFSELNSLNPMESPSLLTRFYRPKKVSDLT